MYCLTLIHRYMVQKENIKLTIVKLHCLNCKLFVEDLTGVAFGPPRALTLGIDFTAISVPPSPKQDKSYLLYHLFFKETPRLWFYRIVSFLVWIYKSIYIRLPLYGHIAITLVRPNKMGSFLMTSFGMVYLKWVNLCRWLSMLTIASCFSNTFMSR